ncbi:response regulator [Oxynema aestuarii AP17]|uniref:histidine kinase n=2 Tax=Oxynema TaxID=1492710 RepID=A0A6H1U471_9CYAN|nr:response regulator [Oxynema aestuarii AP17]
MNNSVMHTTNTRGIERRSTMTKSTNDRRGIVVLLVDDRPIVAEAVKRLLKYETDIEFHYCQDGAQVIPLAEKIQPTVILLDLLMPDVDGLVLLRFLRAHESTREVPVVMLSTNDDPQKKAEAFSNGANDYLIKLPDRVELVARIRYHSDAYLNLLKRYEVELTRAYNQELERRVEERTRELTETLAHLQETQSQLIQSEKMSSLGQLVAGIAHEVNNPISFIAGNIEHTSEYVQNLLELIELYERHYPEPSQEIRDFQQEIDLSFVREDLEKIVDSMKMGTDRIREIVLNLRTFSRLDESDMKFVDIHEGIESTLLILQHRLKDSSIEIVKNYGDLPLVECYAGQLNQVFMNLLANAIDAVNSIEEEGRSPQIEIETSLNETDDRVSIRISDNGVGIPEEVKNRIFDPFFTTKPVGEGTGLGLSIGYQIVTDKHQGAIECESSPESGTEFTITIPIQQSKLSDLASYRVASTPKNSQVRKAIA